MAVFGLLMPRLIEGLAGVYRPLYLHTSPDFLTFSLLRFLMVFVALLLPTTLMGATLPLLSWHVASRTGVGVHGSIGRLYASNTTGAVVGTLLAGFWLLP